MDEKIRTLAQKWQPSKRLRTEEQNSKALDTDMIIVPCLVSVLFYTKPFFLLCSIYVAISNTSTKCDH